MLRADALPKNNSVLSKNYYIPKVLNSISFDLKGRSNTSNPNKHQELATTWLYQDKGLNQDGRVEKGMALLLFNVSLKIMPSDTARILHFGKHSLIQSSIVEETIA